MKLFAIICDAPARSYVKGVEQCSGYHGCDFCRQRGQYLHEYKKVVYIETDAEKSSGGSFKSFLEAEHQLRISPLSELLDRDMVAQIPPEYMHLVHLGVMRRLLKVWYSRVLTPSSRLRLSGTLETLGKSLPKEFHRKTKGTTTFRQMESNGI